MNLKLKTKEFKEENEKLIEQTKLQQDKID
jgi:hypothetical protein